MVTEETVMEALSQVYDPEIPINVVDLGLIYGVDIKGDKVHVKMTMTTPGCPLHGVMTSEAKMRVLALDGVNDAEVELVWEPAWTPDRISDRVKSELGRQ